MKELVQRVVVFSGSFVGAGIHCVACGAGLYIGVRLAVYGASVLGL